MDAYPTALSIISAAEEEEEDKEDEEEEEEEDKEEEDKEEESESLSSSFLLSFGFTICSDSILLAIVVLLLSVGFFLLSCHGSVNASPCSGNCG